MFSTNWHNCLENSGRNRPRFRPAVSVTWLLGLLLLCASSSLAQQATLDVKKSTMKSEDASTASEGLILEPSPMYLNFTGSNGLELKISRPRTQLFDYTLMFWVRSLKSYEELRIDPAIKDTKAYLFKLENSVGCYITRSEVTTSNKVIVDGPWLQCDSGDGLGLMIKIDLAELPDMKAWMHITYSANYQPASKEITGVASASYLRIDISTYSKMAFGSFYPVKTNKVFYGCGGPLLEDVGFAGNYRQFWITVGFIDELKVPFMMHEYKVLDYSTLAYYKFEQTIFVDRFEDAFRAQVARPIAERPQFNQEGIAAPFCNSIPQRQVLVPHFYRSGGTKFQGKPIPKFKFREKYIGYSASFWMKNFGQHTFETNPRKGRLENHIFSLDECFALWYDSKTSFRVYVYAKENFYETFSDPVFLPMNEWINIQVSISQQTGITIMTFNQNGDRQQLVQNKVYLAEQYPRGTISFFQSFIGVPYKFNLWQRQIELPIDLNDTRFNEDLIVSFDFTDDNYVRATAESTFVGWRTQLQENGANLDAVEGDSFQFVMDKVPSNANFTNPVLYGQLQATQTQYNVTCPAPSTSLMYLGGPGAKFDISVLVDKTDEYTVEFWFKSDVASYANLNQTRTYLFMMDGRSEGKPLQQQDGFSTNVMAIFVEDSQLKCAPFGFTDSGGFKDPDSVLTFKGINPLTETKWQHISCIYKREHFVKGVYLAINLDVDANTTNSSTFKEQSLRPKTFSKSILKADSSAVIQIFNQNRIQRWNVILGNDANFTASFFGSFKDVRVWKTTRSDAELFSKRFNQVLAQPALSCNLKFMDGSRDVYNAAQIDFSGPTYPKNEQTMKLLPTDLSIIVCATDTYFNPDNQKCTRFPFTSDPSIVYTVVNNVQYGHQMVLESLHQSTMTLPGKFQPTTLTQWSVNVKDVETQYFKDTQRKAYNLDPIFMGDYKSYQLQISIKDKSMHNFFLYLNQTIVPRKCLLVVDRETGEPKRERPVVLDGTNGDLTFKFAVKRIEGCADEYQNQLEDFIKVETQPPIPSALLARIVKQMNAANSTFEVTIPQSVIFDPKTPKNIPIDFVFYLFWTSPQLNNKVSYMNTVQTVTFASKINVRMDYSLDTDRTVDIGKGQDLEVSAICSAFYYDSTSDCTGSSSSTGLTFRWECAKDVDSTKSELLTQYCETWTGSPKLVIPSKLISELGLVNRPVSIRVVVAAIEASEALIEEVPSAAKFRFDGDSHFTWLNLVNPEFEFEWPQKPADAQQLPNILVTKDQTISIKAKGWRPSQNFKVSFQVRNKNEDRILAELTRFKTTSTILTIPAKTLKSGQEYEVIVTVHRKQPDDKREGDIEFTKTAGFTTSTPPSAPFLTITPAEGVMYDTIFTISLEARSGSDTTSYEYVLYGQNELGVDVRITARAKMLAQEPSISFQLPLINKIRAEISSPTGETVTVEKSVTVKKTSGSQDWVQMAKNAIANQQYFLQLFIAVDANSEAQAVSMSANITAAQKLQAVNSAKNVNEYLSWVFFNKMATTDKMESSMGEQQTIELILSTLNVMADYPQFLEPVASSISSPEDSIKTLQRCVDSLEYLLNLEIIIRRINEGELRKTFVSTLGKLMEATSSRTLVYQALQKYRVDQIPKIDWTLEQPLKNPDKTATRRLAEVPTAAQQELFEHKTQYLVANRNLLLKEVVIKNKYLDQLCQLPEATQKVEITTKTLQLQVKQYASNDQFKEAQQFQFVQDATNIKVDVPVDQLLSAARAQTGGKLTFLCVQLSFMRYNPAAGFAKTDTKDFFFENQRVVQMGVLDNEGNHLLEDGNQTGFQGANLVMTYDQRFSKEDYFFNGQTFCAHYNGNIDQDNQLWTDKSFATLGTKNEKLDCQTEYVGLPSIRGQVKCTCNDVTNYYYTIMTDMSRNQVIEVFYLDVDNKMLNVISGILIFIGVILPGVMVCLDARDYQAVEDNVYPVDDYTIAKLERARNKLCKQMIYYNEKEIARYQQYNEFRSGSCTAFATFHRTLHPYINIFSRFDYRLKRLTRFSFVLGQISLITLLVWLGFSDAMIKVAEDYGFDEVVWKERRWFYVSLTLSLLTLPVPDRLCCFFKTQMYLLNDKSQWSPEFENQEHILTYGTVKKLKDSDLQIEHSDGKPESARGLTDREEDESEKDHDSEKYVRAALFDRFLQFKLAGLILIYALWALAIFVSIQMSQYSGKDFPEEQKPNLEFYYTLMVLTKEEANDLLLTWFLAIFVWGVIINELRIVVISILAPIHARDIFDKHHKNERENRDRSEQYEREWNNLHTGMCAKVSCATLFLIPPDSVEIALDALFTIDIRQTKDSDPKRYRVNGKPQDQEKFERGFERFQERKKAKNALETADAKKKAQTKEGQAGETEMTLLKSSQAAPVAPADLTADTKAKKKKNKKKKKADKAKGKSKKKSKSKD